jgi:hypothetical protein
MTHVQAAEGWEQGEEEELTENQAARETARRGKGPWLKQKGKSWRLRLAHVSLIIFEGM